MSGPQDKPGFLAELKRRSVFRVAAVYVVVAWLAIQVGDSTFEPLGLPDGALRVLILLLALGFPVALALAWVFDVTSQGLVRTDETRETAVRFRPTALQLGLVGLGVLVAGLGWLAMPPVLDFEPAVLRSESEPSAPLHAIAVLPFEDLSQEGDKGYLADGLSEEIIHALAQSRQLRVVARTSAFGFRGSALDVREIAHRLGVGAVLEGSVRTVGHQYRVTAQLVEARNGLHLWSGAFDGDLSDVLALQREIAGAVRRRLEGHVVANVEVAGAPAVSREAYDAYLQGQHHLNRRPGRALDRAIEDFERCIELEPSWAPCYAGLASGEMLSWAYRGGASRPEERIARARQASRRALELDPDLPQTHIAMAGIAGLVWDWPGERRSLERAIELSPGSVEARHQLSIVFLRNGELSQALHQARLAVELDPLGYSVLRDGCLVAFQADEYEEAAQLCRRALALQTTDGFAAVNLGRALLQLGRKRESIEATLQRVAAWQRPLGRIWARVLGPERARRFAHWTRLLSAGGGCTLRPEDGALSAAVIGDRDKMYACLDEAADQRRVPLPLTEPAFAPYRSEPRFRAYLQRVRLLP